MSQWSQAVDALKKTGDVGAFVAAVANDLVKDFQLISALPGVKAFEDWLGQVLIAELAKVGFSPTLVGLISTAIQDAL
ncbi:MAG TPA: hypothetical protein VKT30_10225 [Caulobacteraceae bacterium]|nr:hypothetical protein [Caulobacteraceae bacterium]